VTSKKGRKALRAVKRKMMKKMLLKKADEEK
jgi:hypothetical protein